MAIGDGGAFSKVGTWKDWEASASKEDGAGITSLGRGRLVALVLRIGKVIVQERTPEFYRSTCNHVKCTKRVTVMRLS